MKLNRLAVSAAALAIVTASIPSHAAFVQSTTATAAGFTTNTTYGFDTVAQSSPVTTQYSGVTFSSGIFQGTAGRCDFPNFSNSGSNSCLANFTGGSTSAGIFTLTFDSLQTEVGFNLAANSGTDALFEALRSDNSTLTSGTVSGLFLNNTSNFFGFSGSDAFKSIRVTLTGTSNNAMVMDNLTFDIQSGTVPEPGSLALAGLAIAGLLAARRSKIS